MNIRNNSLILLILILILHGFILTKLIFFPYPELFVYPYLTNKGLLPYGQIFDQHFPGLMFLPINLDNLGMNDEFSARYWLIGVTLLTQLLLFWVISRISKSYKLALLGAVLYLIWQPFLEGWVLWIDNFLPLFLLPAFFFSYQALKEKNPRFDLFAAGLFFGLSILFKQVTIPLAGLVFIYFLILRIRYLYYYIIGILPIPVLTGIYFYNLGVIKDLYFWTVEFNLTTFAKFGNKPPFLSGVIRVLGVYSSFLLSYFISDRKLFFLLVIFLIGSFSGDLARFDFVHFQPSLPFVIIGTVLGLEPFLKKIGWSKLLILGYLVMSLVWLGTFYRGHLGDRVLFFDAETKQIAAKIKVYTSPNDEIYLLGLVPHIYQMSDRLPVGRIFVFPFPWFFMESEDRFIEAFKNNPPKLVVRDLSVVIEGYPITEFAKNLNQYIDSKYVLFDKVGNNEFLKLKKDE